MDRGHPAFLQVFLDQTAASAEARLAWQNIKDTTQLQLNKKFSRISLSAVILVARFEICSTKTIAKLS